MDLGYASYYPMIVLVLLFYFFARYEEFHRAAFIVLASFFLYYVIFIFVPVVGPTFYFNAVGVDQIAKGVFPDLGLYFNNHQECLPSPGDVNGIFYHLVESAKEAGERPTAAFPSSHVGCSTVLMLLALHTKKRWIVWLLLPLYVLLCFATVYIQAHYAIDAIAGFITAVVFYLVLMYVSKRLKI
jgi:membrane-associated phospholipid phosphatase